MAEAYRRVAAVILAVGYLEYFCGLLLAILAAIVFANVLMRYFFNAPIVGVDEVALFILAWVAYTGALIAVKRNRHYSISLVVDFFPRRLRAVAEIVTQLIVLVILAITIYYSYRVNMTLRFQRSPALGIPTYFAYATLPITGAGMFIFVVFHIIELARVHLLGLAPMDVPSGPTPKHDIL